MPSRHVSRARRGLVAIASSAWLLARLAVADASDKADTAGEVHSWEASAARIVRCPDGVASKECLLVGDNEKAERLVLYAVDGQGRVSFVGDLALENAGRPVAVGDIEAVEAVGDDVWIVGSHSRKTWKPDGRDAGACPRHPDRLSLVRGKLARGHIEVEQQIETAAPDWTERLASRDGCRSSLIATIGGGGLADELCTTIGRLENGADRNEQEACDRTFNVEGAAAIGPSSARRLWLGLRAPTTTHGAVLLRLKDGDPELHFDGVAAVDLGKDAAGESRGVRELAWQPRDGLTPARLWIIAGPTHGSKEPHALCSVDLDEDDLQDGALLHARCNQALPPSSEGLALRADRTAIVAIDGAKGRTPSGYRTIPLESR